MSAHDEIRNCLKERDHWLEQACLTEQHGGNASSCMNKASACEMKATAIQIEIDLGLHPRWHPVR